MKTGKLTPDDQRRLRDMHRNALELADIIFQRLLQDEQGQNDRHVNAWWRYFDARLDTVKDYIQINIETYLKRQT